MTFFGRLPHDPAALAQFFWSAWEGAVLCAKLEQSSAPLDNVASLFIDLMLQPVAATSITSTTA